MSDPAGDAVGKKSILVRFCDVPAQGTPDITVRENGCTAKVCLHPDKTVSWWNDLGVFATSEGVKMHGDCATKERADKEARES